MEEYVRSDLASSQGKVEVWAWIEKVRDQKSMQFVILKDRSGTTCSASKCVVFILYYLIFLQKKQCIFTSF